MFFGCKVRTSTSCTLCHTCGGHALDTGVTLAPTSELKNSNSETEHMCVKYIHFTSWFSINMSIILNIHFILKNQSKSILVSTPTIIINMFIYIITT
jgi:hypothetical protein